MVQTAQTHKFSAQYTEAQQVYLSLNMWYKYQGQISHHFRKEFLLRASNPANIAF